jgi:hypothetical protein
MYSITGGWKQQSTSSAAVLAQIFCVRALPWRAEHSRILRIAPPAAHSKADLSGGLLRELGEGGVKHGHAEPLLSE